MQIEFSNYFRKRFRKLPKGIREKFAVKIGLFAIDRFNSVLKDHSLVGNLAGLRSFSVTGDFRVVYLRISKDVVRLVDIGKHSHVY